MRRRNNAGLEEFLSSEIDQAAAVIDSQPGPYHAEKKGGHQPDMIPYPPADPAADYCYS